MKKQYIIPTVRFHRISDSFVILAGSDPDNNTDQQIGEYDPTKVTGDITVGGETTDDEGAL